LRRWPEVGARETSAEGRPVNGKQHKRKTTKKLKLCERAKEKYQQGGTKIQDPQEKKGIKCPNRNSLLPFSRSKEKKNRIGG